MPVFWVPIVHVLTTVSAELPKHLVASFYSVFRLPVFLLKTTFGCRCNTTASSALLAAFFYGNEEGKDRYGLSQTTASLYSVS